MDCCQTALEMFLFTTNVIKSKQVTASVYVDSEALNSCSDYLKIHMARPRGTEKLSFDSTQNYLN